MAPSPKALCFLPASRLPFFNFFKSCFSRRLFPESPEMPPARGVNSPSGVREISGAKAGPADPRELSAIGRRSRWGFAPLMVAIVLFAARSSAQTAEEEEGAPSPGVFKKMSLEQLMDMDVTSV